MIKNSITTAIKQTAMSTSKNSLKFLATPITLTHDKKNLLEKNWNKNRIVPKP